MSDYVMDVIHSVATSVEYQLVLDNGMSLVEVAVATAAAATAVEMAGMNQ